MHNLGALGDTVDVKPGYARNYLIPIGKAVAARRSKTRYAVGKYVRQLIATRKWLGDRVFDRIIMRAAT